MKRLLLTLVCCTPLFFLPSISYSLDLTGPSDAPSLSSEQYGPITSIETLWGISTKLRPDDSVSIQQTMVAIYKLNPYAFYKGNINKLIPESILVVPSFEFVKGQTDKEASALIAKYSPRKKTKIIKAKATPVIPVKEEPKEILLSESVAPELVPKTAELVANNLQDKKELVAAEKKLDALLRELHLVNEQLLVSTEVNQGLKLKLQPLQDQLSALKEQLDSEATLNTKLQTIIDDYRAQLDAVEALPFSGDGLINEILRSITSSLTNLLITIISPILLLLAAFVVVLRVRSKRSLAEQEKELAESTAILMEQTGQFDALLTDDFSGEADEELDFSEDSDLPEQNVEGQQEAINIDEDEIERIDLTDADDDAFDVVDLTEADESEMSKDDPFGIEALTAQEDLISSVDLTDSEDAVSEDDPFGIGALVDGDDFGSSSDEDATVVSAAQQADLDLAAEWESQLAGDEQGKPNDVVEQEESSVDLTATSDEIDNAAALSTENNNMVLESEFSATQERQTDLPIDEGEPGLSEITSPESAVDDIDQIISSQLSASQQAETDISDADDSAIDLTESNNSEADALDLDESLIFDASALDDLLEEQADSPTAKQEETDPFAKQLSDVAFNEDVALPKVNADPKNDFISIETLLEDSDDQGKSEPYAELDFDLDLNDFPDVINSEEGVDIDEDENGIGAQLDLARAYLEIDDQAGAKEILLSLVDISNGAQRVEIDKLLTRLQ